MSVKPVLYSFFRSSCAWRVRAALAFKGIGYDIKPVNLVKDGGEQHSAEYKALNPNALVPTLVIDGNVLIESLAIVEYIEETRPDPPLLPKDPVKRAQARAIAQSIGSGIQPLQSKALKRLEESQKQETAQFWITSGFKALESILQKTSARYCVGDEITIADLCLVPQVYNAYRYEVDMSQFPLISRLYTELNKHPAFAETHPSKQPDCPADQR